ncbi:MAG: glycine cleavage system protein GcvH [Granulosicoccus sp.]|nr:glycine cleavage system protein GcvH [Granulosicoccus sp.]
MEIPGDLKFAPSHEWVRVEEDGSVTVGISDHAQEQLGDLVFVETPEVDRVCEAEEGIAVVESVKAASDIYAPVAGTIIDANVELAENPELVNSDPYGEGWLFKMQPDQVDDVDNLMDPDDYEAFIDSSE